MERVKHPEPVAIERHAVAIFGGIQPERLAELMATPDDGLLARFAWVWPEPVPFNLATTAPGVDWAIGRLDRLRCLALMPPATDDARAIPKPRYIHLAGDALRLMTAFARDMGGQQLEVGGLLRAAYGKARGMALRLSLVLEYLSWCGDPDERPEPAEISAATFTRAAQLLGDYLMPMAARVYGDADATAEDRNAATLAKHIMRHRPASLSVRELCRKKLPGMKEAKAIHAAAALLVDAGWLARVAKGDGNGRPPAIYPVNPALLVKP